MVPELNDWIGNERVPPGEVAEICLRSPNDGEVFGPMRASAPEHLERALDVAARLHKSERLINLGSEGRAELLREIAARLRGREDRIAEVESAATGVVLRDTRRLAAILPRVFEGAATVAAAPPTRLPGPLGPVEVHRRPWGPAACLAPWNAPTPIAAHKVASAIAAGCPVILKPSEWAPYGVALLAEAIAEAELPPGTFQLVHGTGTVGQALVQDARVRAISFTGGLAGGRAVARAAAEELKPVQLELGGVNPLVVLEDADLALACEGVVSALTTLNGQWCRALGRLLVHAAVAGELLARLEARFARLRVGDARAEDSEMGPVINAEHHQRLTRAIAELRGAGGRVQALARLPQQGGTFLAPTLITGCRPADTREEIFGPVACLHTFASEDEARALVDDTPYGLAGYVFGAEARALAFARRLELGSIQVNGVSLTALHPEAPRSAWRRSGLGAEGMRETVAFFAGTAVVGVAGRGGVA